MASSLHFIIFDNILSLNLCLFVIAIAIPFAAIPPVLTFSPSNFFIILPCSTFELSFDLAEFLFICFVWIVSSPFWTGNLLIFGIRRNSHSASSGLPIAFRGVNYSGYHHRGWFTGAQLSHSGILWHGKGNIQGFPYAFGFWLHEHRKAPSLHILFACLHSRYLFLFVVLETDSLLSVFLF